MINTLRVGAAGHFLAAHWRWRTLDPTSLEAFQQRRALRMVQWAAAHSPFYRTHWQGCNLYGWRTLPTIDKAAMMAHFDDFNTRGIALDQAMQVAMSAEQTRDFAPTLQGLTVGLSSGTSGHRGLFLVSPQEQAAWAGMILARALHGLPRRKTRVAFFLRSHSNLYAEVNGALLHLRYFDLMSPLAESVATLNQYLPHIVIGPPSLLGFLADAQDAGSLHIGPQRLIAVAEMLEPHDEARLTNCFQVPVHQVYQCTEGLLAVSCQQGSLHIQEDIVAIQCEPLPPAADGTARVTPIVTDLWRRTQPIIRYRLNDVLQMNEQPCRCGSCFRTIARIEGRCDDLCYFLEPGGNRRPFFPDTIRRMVLLAAAGIADYQAVQERDGQLNVHILLLPGADAAAARQLVAASVTSTVRSYNCLAPDVEVDTSFTATPAGQKRRRVQRIASI
jgi:putative adenylate-forming enzyme